MTAHKTAAPEGFKADRAKLKAARRMLADKGVTTCYAVFVDINGVPKSKATPIDAFEHLCDGHELYTVGANEGLGLAGPQEDECATVPDLDSLVVCPWDSTQAWMNADLYYHGAPYENDPRGILRRVLARAAKKGMRFNLGIEPEFYILRRDAAGRLVPITRTRFQGPNACYDLNLSTESNDFLQPLAAWMKDLGWGLYSFDQECGRGQHEFDFGYTDALAMSDRFTFLRFMIRKLAHSIGAEATYMPKPFHDDFRNGAHFNMSLADIKTGRNLFEIGGAKKADRYAKRYGPPLSDLGYQFIAGVLRHAEAICAVACPTYNSYQGLISRGQLADFSWAPILVAWGDNNRSAMLRAPMNRQCVENRAVDMSCNPYLVAALTLAAGLEGIEQGLEPGDPVNQDIYRISRREYRTRGIRTLPPTLLHALDAFDNDPLVAETFGPFRDIYFEHKMRVWERDFYEVSNEHRERMLTAI
jgi:glutamine synthetase